jgi:hypothetical protein
LATSAGQECKWITSTGATHQIWQSGNLGFTYDENQTKKEKSLDEHFWEVSENLKELRVAFERVELGDFRVKFECFFGLAVYVR